MGGGDPHVGGCLVRDVDVGAARAHADPRLVSPRLAGHLDRRAPRGRVVRRLAEHHVVAVHERGVERAVGRHLEDRVVLPLHALALTEVGLGAPADAVVARDAHVHRDARALLACLRAAEPVVHRVDVRSSSGSAAIVGSHVSSTPSLISPAHPGAVTAGAITRASAAVIELCPAFVTATPTCASASASGSSPSASASPPFAESASPSTAAARVGSDDPCGRKATAATTSRTTTTINDATQPLRIPRPPCRMTGEPYAWA